MCMRECVHLCVQWGVLAKLNASSSGLGEEKVVCQTQSCCDHSRNQPHWENYPATQLHFGFSMSGAQMCTHARTHTAKYPVLLLSIWPGGQIKSCCGRISFWCGMLSESEKKSMASARWLSTANFSPNKIEKAKTPKDVREPQLIVRPKWCKKQAARYSEDESEFLIAWLYTQKNQLLSSYHTP